MEKNNKIVLGAVLILFVAMFSFSFASADNEITGQQFRISKFASDNAKFISQTQTIPTLTTGQTTTISIVMQNTGKTTWTKANNYKLGSQNPQDNLIWSLSRVELDSNDRISPGQQKKFTFIITAPSTPGTYNFQWKMLREKVNWFGDFTQNIVINVVQPTTMIPMPSAQATSCDGDAVCEVGDLSVKGSARFGGTPNLPAVYIQNVLGNFLGSLMEVAVNTEFERSVSIDEDLIVDNVIRTKGLQVAESFELGTTQTPSGSKASLVISQNNANLEVNTVSNFYKNVYMNYLLSTNELLVNSLSGQGDSYACLDSNGRLFRSDVPCR